MAVTYNSSNTSGVTAGSSVSFSVTVVAGSNRVAVVGVEWEDLGFGHTVSSVKLDGVNATFVQLIAGTTISEQYYVVAPATGARTCAVVWTGNVIGVVGCAVFNNVGQTIPIGQKATASGSSTTPTVNITSTISGSMVVDSASIYDPFAIGATVTVGANQTERWNSHRFDAGSLEGMTGAGSHELSAGGTVTMSWTITASKLWVTAALELLEFVAPPTVRLGGYTSYDIGQFDVSSPHTPVLPEVEARIRAGDQRFMKRY